MGARPSDAVSDVGTDGGHTGVWYRRTVTVEDLRGLFVRREGRWMLGNGKELRMQVSAGGSQGALGRLLALAATLDADAVVGGDLRRLSRLLGEIASSDVPCLVRVPSEMQGRRSRTRARTGMTRPQRHGCDGLCRRVWSRTWCESGCRAPER